MWFRFLSQSDVTQQQSIWPFSTTYTILSTYDFVFNKSEINQKKNSFRFKENIYYTKVTYWQKTPLRQALTKRGSNRISFWKVVLGSVKFTVFLWTKNSVMASMNEAWFIYDRSGRLAQCIRPLRSQDTINLSFKFVKTCPTLISSEVNSTDTFQNKD